jgi:hypothetical protein
MIRPASRIGVGDRKAAAVLAPEKLVGDPAGRPLRQRLSSRALGGRIGGAIGAGVVEKLMGALSEHLLYRVPEQRRRRRVRVGDPTLDVIAEDALAGGADDPFVVLGKAIVGFDRGDEPDQDQAGDQGGESDDDWVPVAEHLGD